MGLKIAMDQRRTPAQVLNLISALCVPRRSAVIVLTARAMCPAVPARYKTCCGHFVLPLIGWTPMTVVEAKGQIVASFMQSKQH